MTAVNISNLDIAIIVVFVCSSLFYGYWISSRKRSLDTETYFLAGRNLTWPIVGLTLFAANISSNSFIGLAGSAYRTGLSVFSYEWMATVILIIFAVFFLPFYLKTKVYTMPEFLERRYSVHTRYYVSFITIMLNVFIDLSVTLFSGAKLMQMMMPTVPIATIVIVVSCIAGVFAVKGGMTSVAYIDSIQAVILLVGAILTLGFLWDKVGGLDALKQLPEGHMNIIKPISDDFLPWPGLITGVFIIGFYFWATNQFIVQRTLAAKSTQHGQWGSLLAGFLKLMVLFLLIFPGLFARVLYPDLEDANIVYPKILFDFLPQGIIGVVVAGFMSAMISGSNSALNSASTLFTMDFYAKMKPNSTTKELTIVGKISTVGLMVVACVWAPNIDLFPSMWDYLQSILSFVCPPMVALFMVGLFWRRANSTGAIAAIVVGFCGGLFSIIFSSEPWMPHYLYISGIQFVLACITLVGVSLFTSPPPEEVQNTLIWHPSNYTEETKELQTMPWYFNYRVQSVFLLVIIILLLIIF